jgi:hypothetical protein
MGTRSITRFLDSADSTSAVASVYRHWDGYPDGAGSDILRFLAEARPFGRNADPSYLAAKYVVFLANIFRRAGDHQLNFISVGIVPDKADWGQDYTYDVICDGTGRVICRDSLGTVHEIPAPLVVSPSIVAPADLPKAA